MASKGIVLDKRLFMENLERFCKHFRVSFVSSRLCCSICSVPFSGCSASWAAMAAPTAMCFCIFFISCFDCLHRLTQLCTAMRRLFPLSMAVSKLTAVERPWLQLFRQARVNLMAFAMYFYFSSPRLRCCPLQLSLLTYEFPDTIVFVTSTQVTLLTSSKKGSLHLPGMR